MTAEIAILNKSAVVLAADSAVTISGTKAGKIYNTANKLFNLSKYHPIGIMIYNSANFISVPWETIIKAYRSFIKNDIKDSIYNQTLDFIEFVKNNKDSFSDNDILELIKEIEIRKIFDVIKNNVTEDIERITQDNEDADVSSVVNNQLSLQINKLSEFEYYTDISEDYKDEFLDKNNDLIIKLKNEIFQKIPLSTQNVIDLNQIVFEFVFKNHFFQSKTGIVITGFGAKEYLPSLVDIQIKCFIDERLLYKINQDIKTVNGYSIHPFADDEMVQAFISGINPKLSQSLETSISSMFNKIGSDFGNIPELNTLNPTDKDLIIEKVKKMNDEISNGYINEFSEVIKRDFIQPFVNTIESLPKEELAIIAESLIYLTSLRKRMSDEKETVGGDIDVAVISKGDGFIWIKRKHYFKPELNPHFFKNYFK